MKTGCHGIRIADEGDRARSSKGGDLVLSIRTRDGNLMTNRLRALLKTYRERVVIPTALAVELVDAYIKASHRLKAANRRIEQLENDLRLAKNGKK